MPEPLPDLLIVGQEHWDEIERRNQLLVRALAHRHPFARFLFAELPGNRPRRLRRVADNVFAVRASRPLPDRVPFLARVNDRLEARQLERAARAAGLERPTVWTQDPRAASLVPLLRANRLVYDLTDDWSAFERDERRRARVERRIDSLARRADVVIACSSVLEQYARTRSGNVAYVPNAVEPPAPVEPVDLGLPRPVLGYAGTLHDSRLDVELLARAAELRPAWSFALLGPDLLEPASRDRLRALPNVHWLGVVPHAEVRAWLAAFEVCLVPHLLTPFTRSLDPLKLYEYLAAGRPIVSTMTGNARELAAHVTEVVGAEGLVAAAARALAEDDAERGAARRAAVAGATWDARAARVEEALGVAPAAAPSADVSVVIVNWNRRELLSRCLDAVRAQAGPVVQTVVVDNGSTDGSGDLVRTRFAEVDLIELDENAGFARANNLALGLCHGEFVLLLNSDAFLAPDALARLVEAARRRPSAAAFGPRLLNPDGSLQRSAWPFPRARRLVLEALLLHRPLRRLALLDDLGAWPHDEERAVEFLIGACLLVRREALLALGGLDERFWFYGEEADLCRRLAARGHETVLVPTATCVHVGGASSTDASVRLRHFYGAQKRFLRKHGGRFAWPVARCALFVGSVLRARWRTAAVALDWRL